MNKSNQKITFKGNSVEVAGTSIEEGQTAPSFKVTGTDMADIELQNYKDKVLLLLTVPSVETPVCSIETKRFNEEASKLPEDISILAVSLDLPFAQKRFCDSEGIGAVRTASDFKYRTIGENYGAYIKDLGLLARAVFVIGKDGKVRHVEYVSEVAEEPNYSSALEAAKAAV